MIDKEAIWYIIAFILGIMFILRIYYVQKRPDTLYVKGIAINALRDAELIELHTAQDSDPLLREAVEKEVIRRKL